MLYRDGAIFKVLGIGGDSTRLSDGGTLLFVDWQVGRLWEKEKSPPLFI